MIDIYIAFIVANLIIMIMLWAYDAKCYGRTFLEQVLNMISNAIHCR